LPGLGLGDRKGAPLQFENGNDLGIGSGHPSWKSQLSSCHMKQFPPLPGRVAQAESFDDQKFVQIEQIFRTRIFAEQRGYNEKKIRVFLRESASENSSV
jgi:hypothetical protein